MTAIDGKMADPMEYIDERYASMDKSLDNPSADVRLVISADRR